MYTSPANLSREQRINSIIEQRKPLAEEIEHVQTHLNSLSSAMSNLENYRRRLEVSLKDVDVKEQLNKTNFSHIIQQIEEELEKLRTIKERFSRSTLNIGVVGLMGQGKSTLLKSLSGLTDNEIPAFEGGACTAVRSTIENQEGEIKAQVILHSEDSFLKEVIWPYYEELRLTSPPTSLEDFASKPFPEAKLGGATDEEMYNHLRADYYYNLAKYRHLLKPGEQRKLPIKKDEIPEYVVQKRDPQGRLLSFKHLAVREVKIFCPFQDEDPNKKSDIGKVALVDVPGLGDSRLGDEKLMLKTLGQEVDVVLFVRRPDPQRYQWLPVDTQLYDTAAKALNDLEKRSFMILNYSQRINNLKACQTLQNNIDTIKVVRCEIANCSNYKNVNRVFNLVLDYLAVSINDLDKRYAQSSQDRLIEIYYQINVELANARLALAQYARESRQFKVLFYKLLQDIVNGLVELRDELFLKHEEVDPDFKKAADAVMQACEINTGIPSEDEIVNRSRDPEFKGAYQAVYRVYIAELRTHLSQHFLELDNGLSESIDKMKSLVTNVLVTKGRLGELTQSGGTKFLKEMADLLAERQNKLALGFRILWEFKFSYGGSLLPLIRKQLDGLLQPDINKAAPDANNFLPDPSNAVEVRTNLEALHKKAVESCKEILDNWLKAPSQVRYYMVEEFVDRVLYAKDMKTEWEIFLSDEDVRSKVWPEFKESEKRQQMQQEWLNAVARVEALNQQSAMLFLN